MSIWIRSWPRFNHMQIQSILPYFERLESLLRKLPGGLQKPVLKEITPIKNLFLKRRPPRILLLGSHTLSADDLASALYQEDETKNLAPALPPCWAEYGDSTRGRLHILDGHKPEQERVEALIHSSLRALRPDVVVFAKAPGETVLGDAMQRAAEILSHVEEWRDLPLVAVALGPVSEEARLDLLAELAGHADMGKLDVSSVILNGPSDALAEAILSKLPMETQLEAARALKNQAAQKRIALTLVRSNAAICAALGAQPIPLADLPFLTALQSAMVAGIIYVSGRPVGPRTVAEFLGALGANIGLGMVLRESSRAVLKFVPFWGHIVSGGIAAAGTYAIGRAATAYFVDGKSMQQARKVMRKEKPALPFDPRQAKN